MLITTKAIVLNAIKFQDSSLIVKCYTEIGIKSYLLKGVLKNKKGKIKPAYFQLFTLLDLIANHNNKGKLNYIKEISISKPFHSLNTNIYKSAMVLFLAEILTNVLQEEEENLALFNYLETSLVWLDNNNSANFHLLFFNLKEGVFSYNKPFTDYIANENLILLKQLIGTDFDALLSLQIKSKNKQAFLSFLIAYFALHLPAFRKPRSLTILQSVFK